MKTILLLLFAFLYTFASHVVVLYADGRVGVVEKKLLYKLKSQVVYYQEPIKMKLHDPIIRGYSVCLHLDGSSRLSFAVQEGQRLSLSPYNLSINYSGSCTGSLQSLVCQRGDLFIDYSSSSQGRLIISSENYPLNILGSFVVGTGASLSGLGGRGVIVGVVDTGIDYCHWAFRNPDGSTRLLYFYDLETGRVLDRNGINQAIQRGVCNGDPHGHGTMVAGILAGRDHQTGYSGIAPMADIIGVKALVQGDISDAGVIQGIDFIRQKAKELSKPAVVNISLGTHNDPHDGTGLLDRYIDQVSASGFIVVVAAGNEGHLRLHARARISSLSNLYFNLGGFGTIVGWYSGSITRLGVCSSSCLYAQAGQTVSSTVGGCEITINASTTRSP